MLMSHVDFKKCPCRMSLTCQAFCPDLDCRIQAVMDAEYQVAGGDPHPQKYPHPLPPLHEAAKIDDNPQERVEIKVTKCFGTDHVSPREIPAYRKFTTGLTIQDPEKANTQPSKSHRDAIRQPRRNKVESIRG